uniref:Uncharacterized protein n=1 Tax=Arundo donax TaxID=35708 RepID=A0A0A8Z2B6_ARUDO
MARNRKTHRKTSYRLSINQVMGVPNCQYTKLTFTGVK